MASEKEKKKKEKNGWKKSIILYLHDWLYLLILVLLVFLIFFRVIVVSGESMYSTLLDGDYLLLLSNLLYQDPEYGDIVVISKESFDDGEPIVKRVIATEGQKVDIDFDSGIVYVDDVALQEEYVNCLTYNSWGVNFPVTVPENCLFVLGDNRGVSLDSRSPQIGMVDKREVLGKAIYLFLPGTNGGQQMQDKTRIGAIE